MFPTFTKLLKFVGNHKYLVYLLVVITVFIFPETVLTFKIDLFEFPLAKLIQYNIRRLTGDEIDTQNPELAYP